MDTFKIKVPVIKNRLNPKFPISKFQEEFKSLKRRSRYAIELTYDINWSKAIDWIAPEIKVK